MRWSAARTSFTGYTSSPAWPSTRVGTSSSAASWVDHLYVLIRSSLDVLATDPEAVAQAFSWFGTDAARESDRPAAEAE